MNTAKHNTDWNTSLSIADCKLVSGLGWCFVIKRDANPLDPIILEIKLALKHGLYYLAIHGCLSIPEICSGLECRLDDNPFNIKARYISWCERYLEPIFDSLTSRDFWALRGGVIFTNKKFGRPPNMHNRVLFMLPNGQPIFSENISSNGNGPYGPLMQIDTTFFCRAILRAADQWYAINKENKDISRNQSRLVRRRPHGIVPNFSGMPLIA